MKKIIILTMMMGVVFCGCGNGEIENNLSSETDEIETIEGQEDKTAVEKIDDDVNLWESYQDDILGIKFKYPKQCYVNGSPSGKSTGVSCKFIEPYSYMVYEDHYYNEYLYNLSLKELVENTFNANKEAGYNVIGEIEKIIVDKQEAYQFVVGKGYYCSNFDIEKKCDGFITLEDKARFIFVNMPDGKNLSIRLKDSDSISEKIFVSLQFVREEKIEYSNDLSEIIIDTSDWNIFLNSGYDISFKYPNNWDYVIKEYINTDLINFYSNNLKIEMEFSASLDADMNCFRNNTIKDVKYFTTVDPQTDILYDLTVNTLPNGNIRNTVRLSWEQNRNANSWKKYLCFKGGQNNGRILFKFNSDEKESKLAIIEEIIKSFRFLSKEEIEEVNLKSKFEHENEKIIKEVKLNPEKFFTKHSTLKLFDIQGFRGGPINDYSDKDDSAVTIDDIQNAVITFKGKTVLNGNYMYGGRDNYFGNQVCFREYIEENGEMIPKFVNTKELGTGVSFCFSNQEFALKEFNINSTSTVYFGTSTIEIDNYVNTYAPLGTIDYAHLLRVVDFDNDEKILDIDISDWKIYNNEKYDISFKVDPEWPESMFEEKGDFDIVRFGPSLEELFGENSYSYTLVIYNKKQPKFYNYTDECEDEETIICLATDNTWYKEPQKVIINGLSAYSWKIGDAYTSNNFFIEGKNNSYLFSGIDTRDEYYAVVNSFIEN